MSIPPEFRDAFDGIAEAARKAGELKHIERPTPPLERSAESTGNEVSVTILDGRIRALRLEDTWLVEASGDQIEALIMTTINRALDDWAAESLSMTQNLTPELSEVTAVIARARAQVHEAFGQVVERSRSM